MGTIASDSPAVSVVIATYNRAEYLPETIDSVLGQKFSDFELIVVDDGSTDNTPELVRGYGDRVRYFSQPNSGPSAARNLGVRHARGKWISIQDSDDVCAANHLETLYATARTRPECAMVFANGAYLGGKEHNRETIIPPAKSSRLAAQGVKLVDLFEKSIVRLQASLIARKCYDAVGGHDESLWISMDLDLAFKIFMRYPVAYLDEIVFYYRKHEGNIGSNQERRLLENIRVIEKLVADFPQTRDLLGRGKIDRRLAYRYYRLGKARWKAGGKEAAREALHQAVMLCPLALKYRLYQLRWA